MTTGNKFGGNAWHIVQVVLVSGICIWGMYEASYGLLQVLGLLPSRHSLFALTGNFQNPGPYGGFLACVMSVAGSWMLLHPGQKHPLWIRGTTILATMAFWSCFIVLPASMSRTGWLALSVALCMEIITLPVFSKWLVRHRKHVLYGIPLAFCLCVAAFLIKQDSALGRLHMWHMECIAIARRPWSGAGAGKDLWAYGEAQEAFFRMNFDSVSPTAKRIAGCPEFTFNEYLGLGMQYGIPAMITAILLIVCSIIVLNRVCRPLASGLTAWAIFAMASYPLYVKQLRFLFIGFVGLAVLAGTCRTLKIVVGGRRFPIPDILPLVMAVLLVGLMELNGKTCQPWTIDREEVRSIYTKGYNLHQERRYGESTAILEQGARMSCDPMFEIIMGKNAEAIGDYDRAEELYLKAHYMVPSRLYPMIRLSRLHLRTGCAEKALEEVRNIVSTPLYEQNPGMVRLHKEALKTLDSLKVVLHENQE